MENFAFAFSPAGLSHLVQIAWQDQPRRYNDYGYVDPSGPIHFTDFQVRFNVYNTLQNPLTGAFVSGPSVDLGIDGFYSYIQDTDFTLHVVDFPGTTTYGALHCDTLLLAETTETTIDTILATLTGGAGDLPPTLTLAGPACRVADFLPTQVLVPRTSAKIELTYSRASAEGNGGLTFAGNFTLGLRQPSVSIDGPSEVRVHGEQSVTESYLGLGTDLRPPVTVIWTSPDAIAISSADTVRPTVTWSVAGLAVNDFVERSIQLTAVDADGVTATAGPERDHSTAADRPGWRQPRLPGEALAAHVSGPGRRGFLTVALDDGRRAPNGSVRWADRLGHPRVARLVRDGGDARCEPALAPRPESPAAGGAAAAGVERESP